MRRLKLGSLVLCALAASCLRTDTATGPAESSAPVPSIALTSQLRDSLALALARALAVDALRLQLLKDLRDSPFPDHAIDFRSYLHGVEGHGLLSTLAQNLGRSEHDVENLLAALPRLTLELDRTLDRITWKGTPDIIVYAPSVRAADKVIDEATARGFTVTGTQVVVPTLEAGPGPYLALRQTNIDFGENPEQRRSAAVKHSSRLTASSPAEERQRSIHVGDISLTMLPPPACPPDCVYGGPSSDGIAMPSPYTAAYCFGWTSWGEAPIDGTNDTDHDGIRQDCEYQLAYQFRPQMARNSHEDAPDREPYWSVTRVPGSVTGVRIFYALSYWRDAGEHTTGYTSHDGDTEFVVLELENNMNDSNYRLWEVTSITLSAHWNSSEDHTATYAYNDLEYPVSYRGRPRVWESWDKHANYRSKAVCNNTAWDVCTTTFTGTVYDDLEVISSANVGNQYDRTPYTRDNILLDCVPSRKGYPGTECYWSSPARDNVGWHIYSGQEGATNYFNMFYYYGF